MKNKEELPMNLDRGSWQPPLDFARNEEWARHAKLFRTEPTDPASSDQPALNASPEDALMELIVSPKTFVKRGVKSKATGVLPALMA
jgi:hypothetical protein